MSTLEVLRMIVTALENTLEAWDYNGGGDAWCREVHGEYIESARAVVEVGKKTIYAVAPACTLTHVLLQLGDKHGEQVRLVLTPDQAWGIVSLLMVASMKVENNLAASKSLNPPADFQI
jgi:hypothetical protein